MKTRITFVLAVFLVVCGYLIASTETALGQEPREVYRQMYSEPMTVEHFGDVINVGVGISALDVARLDVLHARIGRSPVDVEIDA